MSDPFRHDELAAAQRRIAELEAEVARLEADDPPSANADHRLRMAGPSTGIGAFYAAASPLPICDGCARQVRAYYVRMPGTILCPKCAHSSGLAQETLFAMKRVEISQQEEELARCLQEEAESAEELARRLQRSHPLGLPRDWPLVCLIFATAVAVITLVTLLAAWVVPV